MGSPTPTTDSSSTFNAAKTTFTHNTIITPTTTHVTGNGTSNSTTVHSSYTLPLTLTSPAPTTYPTDSTQQGKQSDTPITLIIIISCIGLLGFGIGYLRLRQMRRVGRRTLSSPSSSSINYSSPVSHSLERSTVPPDCCEIEHRPSEPTPSLLPLYAVSSSNITSPERVHHNSFRHQPGVRPPSYEDLLVQKDIK